MADKMNPETFSLIYLLKSEIQRKISQNNFLSVSKQLRHYISLCNSIMIKLIQNANFSEFEFISKKCVKAHDLLQKYGTLADKLWQGKILTWIVETYYFWITRQLALAIQLMYKIHLLVEEIKQAGGIMNLDLKIVINFISFVVLWSGERLENCEEFLRAAKKAIDVEAGMRKKMRINLNEIKIVVAMGSAAVLYKVHGNVKLALKVLDGVGEDYRDFKSFRLLRNMMKVLWKEQDLVYSSDFGRKEILVTVDFEKVVFDLCIAPFKDEECPLVEGYDKSVSKSPSSNSDKNSTKSTFSRSTGCEKTGNFTQNLMKFYYHPRPIRNVLNVYSPSVEAHRPNSSLRIRKGNKLRTKSSGKY